MLKCCISSRRYIRARPLLQWYPVRGGIALVFLERLMDERGYRPRYRESYRPRSGFKRALDSEFAAWRVEPIGSLSQF